MTAGLENIKRIPRKLRNLFFPAAQWGRLSFAQEGEDLVLARLLDGVESGYYIDVGSHHPFRFSNTYLFYQKGWNGICIDPLPGSKTLFDKFRPRDISLELGVSLTRGEMQYYMFNEPALNTFDETLANERDGLKNYRLQGRKSIQTLPLSEILYKYINRNQTIDFISVDAEGLDLQVLSSNEWNLYRPKFVVAECLNTNLLQLAHDPLVIFLASVGYIPNTKTGNTVIFSTHEQG